MTTDGTKMVYSWDDGKGEITQKTETVKRYSDSLKNPLNDDLDAQIRVIERLFESKKFQSEKKSKHHYILVDTLNVLRELQKNGSGYSFEEMEQLKLDFYKHLERNPSSEILDKFNCCYIYLKSVSSN
jgi:hypothetical protein